jgi:predicted transglutaminase-like cysteine proteinase
MAVEHTEPVTPHTHEVDVHPEVHAEPHPDDSFIRSAGRMMRSLKLGDLLVASHLITQDQLKAALKAQRETGERLGTVLVQQGAITARQLYGKLAEQWCLKVSTAGITLAMQFLSPSAARADDGNAQLRLASAMTPAISQVVTPEVAQHPSLFGTTEIKSNNIGAFSKWTSVMHRYDQEMKTQANSPHAKEWKAHLDALQGASFQQKLEGVNNYMNAQPYVEDEVNYHVDDYWATPLEFLANGGDCEDYAIAKYASLRALGVPADDLRIAIVQDQVKHVPHAILIVYNGSHAYVLDNQNKHVEDAQNVSRYKPIFSINGNNWWLHKTPHIS